MYGDKSKTRRVSLFKFNQHIHVAFRSEIVTQDGTKKSQPADMSPLTKFFQFLFWNSDFYLFHALNSTISSYLRIVSSLFGPTPIHLTGIPAASSIILTYFYAFVYS